MVLQAQETAVLPELPGTQSAPSTPAVVTPGGTTRSLPNTRQAIPRLPRMTQEQMDKANKDKNWLTEGLKKKEMQAGALREEEARSQKSIIDEILERNQQQATGINPENTSKFDQKNESGKMRAALSTTAWEPLEPIQSSSYEAAMGNNTPHSNKIENYKKIDEKTGISNVFFNPVTGSFDSKPTDYGSNLANRPELQKPWIQQKKPIVENTEQRQVNDFEARMIQQARAQNKLPENYQNQTLSVNDARTDLLAINSPTGGLNTVNPNLSNRQFSANNATASNNNYAASAARLRMMEEERQRKLKKDKRPDPIDMHSSFKGKGIEINPRF